MAFVVPRFTKGEVNRSGVILADESALNSDEWYEANDVLANWRGAHAYPINTFQATLRSKLKAIDPKALVAQRLKRTPSIIAKLRRFDGMQLARMQDIGGLRAVVTSMAQLQELADAYRVTRFAHEKLPTKNYIVNPKNDGYRSVHFIFRYKNDSAPEYNGLSLELQIRTRMQHAWATAVETMGTYLGQALKSGQGDNEWKAFFQTASASLAGLELTPTIPGFEGQSQAQIHQTLALQEKELRVLDKLKGFAVATDKIHQTRGQGSYHLIILNSAEKTVELRPYPISRLEEANRDYAAIETRAKSGEPLEAVLVSAGPIEALKKAYPNYFLDTEVFIAQIEDIVRNAASKTISGRVKT